MISASDSAGASARPSYHAPLDGCPIQTSAGKSVADVLRRFCKKSPAVRGGRGGQPHGDASSGDDDDGARAGRGRPSHVLDEATSAEIIPELTDQCDHPDEANQDALPCRLANQTSIPLLVRYVHGFGLEQPSMDDWKTLFSAFTDLYESSVSQNENHAACHSQLPCVIAEAIALEWMAQNGCPCESLSTPVGSELKAFLNKLSAHTVEQLCTTERVKNDQIRSCLKVALFGIPNEGEPGIAATVQKQYVEYRFGMNATHERAMQAIDDEVSKWSARCPPRHAPGTTTGITWETHPTVPRDQLPAADSAQAMLNNSGNQNEDDSASLYSTISDDSPTSSQMFGPTPNPTRTAAHAGQPCLKPHLAVPTNPAVSIALLGNRIAAKVVPRVVTSVLREAAEIQGGSSSAIRRGPSAGIVKTQRLAALHSVARARATKRLLEKLLRTCAAERPGMR